MFIQNYLVRFKVELHGNPCVKDLHQNLFLGNKVLATVDERQFRAETRRLHPRTITHKKDTAEVLTTIKFTLIK